MNKLIPIHVELYIGFTDHTWQIEEVSFLIESPYLEFELIQMAKLHLISTLDVLDKDNEIAFTGLYHYEEEQQ